MPDPAPTDPVLVRRARIAKLVSIGQRLGYALFLVAMIAFFVGLATEYTPGLVRVIVGSLLGGSAVLAPAIVFGYAVKAAEREDAGLPLRPLTDLTPGGDAESRAAVAFYRGDASPTSAIHR